MESLTKRMAAWPAWRRRLVLALILMAFFGLVGVLGTAALMTRLHGTLARVLILALLVGLTWLAAYVSRAAACSEAEGEMRREDRRYLAEFVPAMAVYFALMLFVWPLHRSTEAAWLKAHAYDLSTPAVKGWTAAPIERWDARFAAELPKASYPVVASDRRALGGWLAQVRRYGFAILTGTPTVSGISAGWRRSGATALPSSPIRRR